VDGVLAIGTWNEAYWESLGVPRAKIATATYAVDNEFFRQRAEEVAGESAILRASWGASEGHTVFLFAARLVGVKAPDLLLKAFLALAGDPRAHLVLVGNGPLEGRLRAEQEALNLPRVHWAGFVNQRELPAYYRAADVMVLPSRFEPWGLVVNEAMACGTPCIVSDVVGAGGDLVEGQETGRVFRSEDAGHLAEALKAALDPGLRSRWKANLPRTLEKASFHQNLAALESLLDRVTGPAGRRRPAP
jgi:glycosyltransferase involved in cell wall biosynthesis